MKRKYIYIFGGAIGDALLGAHLGRSLAEASGGQVILLATRENTFVEELVRPIPHVRLVTIPKRNVRSWIYILLLIFSINSVTYLEPFSGITPKWWRIVIAAATFRKKSKLVCCSIRRREGQGVLNYNCRRDNVFDLVPRVLNRWGIVHEQIVPKIETGWYQSNLNLPERPYIVFHFFAPSSLRSFPVSKAKALITAVHLEFPSHSIVLTAARIDAAKAAAVADGIPAHVFINLEAPDLISILANASLYVGVDTGITHMACQLGTYSVTLGNRSNPCWLPYYAPNATVLFEALRCRCNGDKTGECREHTSEGTFFRCLVDIPIESIIRAIDQHILIDQEVSATM